MCALLHLLICTALRAHVIVVEALYKINCYYYYFKLNREERAQNSRRIFFFFLGGGGGGVGGGVVNTDNVCSTFNQRYF